MKYETPELTTFRPAINAIQGTGNSNKMSTPHSDSFSEEGTGAYEDWE
jgi:hypothetical protein